eukprot:768726-Hanusia_phi.AAC.2
MGESNIQKNNQKIKKWNKRAGDVNEALHRRRYRWFLQKLRSLENLKKFLEADMRYAAFVWGHYCKRRCGRVRLDNYIGKKRFVDKS